MTDFATDGAPPALKQRLAESYDAIAPTYNEWTQQHSVDRLSQLSLLNDKLRLSSLSPTLEEPIRMLELGCGCGLPTARTILSWHPSIHLVANDLSPVQLDLARINLAEFKDRVSYDGRDMMSLSFPDGSLDAVVGMYSLIHLPQEEQRTLLSRIARWLKPGGRLLANFSPEESKGVIMQRWLGEKGWMFWSSLGLDGTTAVLQGNGMKVEHAQHIGEEGIEFVWVIACKHSSGDVGEAI